MVIQNKKMMILDILDVLQKHSDADHRLNYGDIIGFLYSDHGMSAERKAVRNNLRDLVSAGYPIQYSVFQRGNTAENDGNEIWTDFYYEGNFTEVELRMLITACSFSRYIPASQEKELVKKLEGLSSTYFHKKVSHILSFGETIPQNKQMMNTIDVLSEAIGAKKMVSFVYNNYGTDLKQHPRTTPDGAIKRYSIHPYRMVDVNGKFYLICSTSNHNTLSHYRLDRITEIRLQQTRSTPIKQIKGCEQGFDARRYVAESLNMFSGEVGLVRFRFRNTAALMNEIVDCFGYRIRFIEKNDDMILAEVKINYQAMKIWAMSHLSNVVITYPEQIISEIRQEINQGMQAYSQEKPHF